MPTRSDCRPRLSGVIVGTLDGVGAYAMKVSSPSALGGGGGGGGGASLAAACFLAMCGRSCSRLAAMRSSSVLYLRGMMRSGIINDDGYDDGSRRWQQSSMGMVDGGWE
jgi:hypothetical protein